MKFKINKVAVIGSGVMGGQIAAYITNAGIPVVLLDIVLSDKEDRNYLARTAIEKLLQQGDESSPFMQKKNAELVTIGNLEDDLDKIADADWIIEAVIENPKIKEDLYKKIDAIRKKGSIISSNTSTIPLKNLAKGQSAEFEKDLVITHFFNPLRYMKLLELVSTEKTDPESLNKVAEFCDVALGNGVVCCKDSPGFIANRLGIFFLQCGVDNAFAMGLSVEEADAVLSTPVGMPKSGVFGLMDIIGLDLIPLIAQSFFTTLPQDDVYRTIKMDYPLIEKMIKDGYIGRKGKGGFYRMIKTDAGKVMESINLKSGEYAPTAKVKLQTLEEAKGNLQKLCESQDKIGQYAWKVLSTMLSYAASIENQIADNIYLIDKAMKLGFNWKYGPFELIDKIGAKWFAEKLEKEGRAVPKILKLAAEKGSFYRIENGHLEYLDNQGRYNAVVHPKGTLFLSDIKRVSKPVISNESASVWDIGDKVLCFELHTKMNTLDAQVFSLLEETVSLIHNNAGKYAGLVIYSEGTVFSAGANLNVFLELFKSNDTEKLKAFILKGQKAYTDLRYAKFPSVAAVTSLTLGGGAEFALHSGAIQAHTETVMGLVELGVGLIPCWGGCTALLCRAYEKTGDAKAAILHTFETIAGMKKSPSAFQARDLLFLRETDKFTMNKDRLLFDAKQRVLSMVNGYEPRKECVISIPADAKGAVQSIIEKSQGHDTAVLEALQNVLCSGGSESDIRELECSEVLKLKDKDKTEARIANMLSTGKPLKN